eukprot:151329_1
MDVSDTTAANILLQLSQLSRSTDLEATPSTQRIRPSITESTTPSTDHTSSTESKQSKSIACMYRKRSPQLQHICGTQQNNFATSAMDKPPTSTFCKSLPNKKPKSSPSHAQNVSNGAMLLNDANILIQNQSWSSYDTIQMNNNGNDRNEERQMTQSSSLDEINNMRSIPSVISTNGATSVVMITNLNENEIDCDKIFTLCGVFGDVQRVKILCHKRDTAFVQLSNHGQAKHVVTTLNRVQLYGKMIHVSLSQMADTKLPNNSPNSSMMVQEYPDAKHRYGKKGSGWRGQRAWHMLTIRNIPIQSNAKDLRTFLCGNDWSDKIKLIQWFDVNSKSGLRQALIKCHSVDIACQILINYHSKAFLGREIKISFATGSHRPSETQSGTTQQLANIRREHNKIKAQYEKSVKHYIDIAQSLREMRRKCHLLKRIYNWYECRL